MTRRVSLAVLVVTVLGLILGHEATGAESSPKPVALAAAIPPTSTTSSSTTSTTEPPTTTTVAPHPSRPPAVSRGEARTTTTTIAKPQLVTGDWAALIDQYAWDTARAYKIMMCESGGRANAYNASGATGLFQIHPGGSKYFDPATNVAAAYAKYKASGWGPWKASEGCWR